MLAGAGVILAAVAAALLWMAQLKLRNAAVVDAGLAFAIGGLAVVDAVFGDGWPPRRAAIAFMMGSWGARLAVYLLYDRVFGKTEDERHAERRRRQEYGDDSRLLRFLAAYSAIALFFSMPALFAAVNGDEAFSPLELAAAGLWLAAFSGEVSADRQLERFKTDSSSAGRVCDGGLWRYSRHPNYFFEWLMWVAYAAFAAGSRWGWLASACPAAMLYLLLKVTGIPSVEAQALRSRGAAYREYQRTTHAFVPWARRTKTAAATE